MFLFAVRLYFVVIFFAFAVADVLAFGFLFGTTAAAVIAPFGVGLAWLCSSSIVLGNFRPLPASPAHHNPV